jgi:type IV pilus assembly protein PilQ
MTMGLPPVWGATSAAPATAQTVNAGYLENVTLERFQDKERVTLTVSKQSGVTVESQPGNVMLVRLENLFVPEELRRSLSDAALANVVRVTPVQKTDEGQSWVLAEIELRQEVPYSVRKEGMNVLIDFNISSLASAAAPATEKSLPAVQPPAEQQTPSVKTSAETGGEAGKTAAVEPGTEKPLPAVQPPAAQQTPSVKTSAETGGEAGKTATVGPGTEKSLPVVQTPAAQKTPPVKKVAKTKSKAGKTAAVRPGKKKSLPVEPPAAQQTPPVKTAAKAEGEAGKTAAVEPGKEVPADSRISIDIQNADIKSVLRLLSEQGGVSIVSDDDVKGTVTLNIRNVTWEEALDIILKMKNYSKARQDNVITVMTMENLTKQKALEKSQREAEKLDTKVISINYASAAGLKENLQEFLKDKDGKLRGSVRVDEHSNSLIIQALPDDITRIIPIIEKIDKPTNQIQIKANIVETTKEMARNLGIQWGGAFGRNVGNNSLYVTPGGSHSATAGNVTQGSAALDGNYNPSGGANAGISGQGNAVNFPASGLTSSASASLGLIFGTIGGNLLEVQLSALQKDNKLNILSSPSITTMDNQMAFTENGTKVPYITTETSGGTTTRTVKFEDVVLRLEITPHVIDGRNMKMKIVVKKDEVDSTRNVEGNPYIIKKKTETSLIVQDGETIVISGLTKQTNTTGETGIPLFKDVPILGWLFKSDTKDVGMEEVLIFITPTILPPQPAAASKPLTDKPVEKGK